MAAVYTDPKRYKGEVPQKCSHCLESCLSRFYAYLGYLTEATAVEYLSGEDTVLYTGLGGVYFEPSTRKLNAKANFQLGLLLMHVFWYDLAIVKFQEV